MKKLSFIFIAFFALLFIGCDEVELVSKNNTNNGNGFVLSYKITEATNATSRASIPIEEGEDEVSSLYLLFFEHRSSGNGLFLEAVDAMASYESALTGTGKLDVFFPDDSGLIQAAEYKVLFCANLEYYSTISTIEDLVAFCEGKSEKEIVNELTLKISGVDPHAENEQTDDSNRMLKTRLPMYATAVKKAYEEEMSIDFTRSVVRMDVSNQASGYTLVSASIWNAYTETPIVISNISMRDFSGARTERYYGVAPTSINNINGALYAFENSVEHPGQKDKVTTCLIIGLLNNTTQKPEYFRVNVNNTRSYHDIMRNKVYRTTIMSVNGEGAPDERGAYEEGRLLVDIDINGWTLDDSGNIIASGETLMAMPTNLISLAPEGDTHEYSIFTLGEGELSMTTENIPDEVTVMLIGNNLYVSAPELVTEWEGKLNFAFAGITASITVEQKFSESEFIKLSLYEMPPFTSAAGVISPAVKVTSSGEWEAKIYNGNYFSFAAGNSQTATLTGVTGDNFNFHTVSANTNTDFRYSFAVIRLVSKPSVSRVLVLKQAGTRSEYLEVIPGYIAPFTAGGGYTENITVYGSGSWTANLAVANGAEAVFVDPIEYDEEEDDDDASGDDDKETDREEATYTSWTKSRGNTFAIRISPLVELNKPATITLNVTQGSLVKSIVIDQNPLTAGNIVIQTRRWPKAGSLFNLKKAATYRYVYNLAVNMRNGSLFGPKGVVKLEDELIFTYTSANNKLPQNTTNIYQMTGNPDLAQRKKIATWLEDKPNRFLFFCNAGDYARTTMKNFQKSSVWGDKGFEVVAPNKSASASRTFVAKPTDKSENPLISYLLKDGPFTAGQELDRTKIILKGGSATNRALSAWPDTFVPIIMAADNPDYCVFGIDPTLQIIWLSDPGIFGSRPTSNYANKENYSSAIYPENVKFLNNFIAWLSLAANPESDFINRFR